MSLDDPEDRPTVRITSPVVTEKSPEADPHPPVADAYRVVGTLGRGGMGVVHLAERRSDRRMVAIKTLTNFHHGEPELSARFRTEADALARLHHPGIVQIFETGARDGAPFLVMEYVAGGALSERIRTDRPSERAAIDLLTAVADAIEHAHRNGVIHRDLKPANILLTEDGRPKVADFGLALTADNPRLTQTGRIAGTPPYMAPEQLSGSKVITPAADIYALGVIMYELLTGALPFPGSTPMEILSQMTGRGALPLRIWKPGIAADLDTICRKCLEYEADKRYRSAADLVEDLRRFRDGRSIRARAIGPIKHAWRWCRRNRRTAVMGATAVSALLVSTVVSTVFAVEATRQWRRASAAVHDREMALSREHLALGEARESREEAVNSARDQRLARQEAERVADRMCKIFEGFEPDRSDLLSNLRREFLDAARGLNEETGENLTTARLQDVLGQTLNSTGDFRHSLPILEKAYRARAKQLGPEHPDTLKTAKELAFAKMNSNQLDEASVLLEGTLAIRRRTLGPDHAECHSLLSDIGLVHRKANRDDRALEHFQDLLSARLRLFGWDDARTQLCAANVAYQLMCVGQMENAVPVLEQALVISEERNGKTSRDTLWIAEHYGIALAETNRTEEAMAVLDDVFSRKKSLYGDNHLEVTTTVDALARVYARSFSIRAVATKSGDDRDTAAALEDFAKILTQRHDYGRLIPIRESILLIRTATCGLNSSETLWAVHHLAFAYEQYGLVGRAIPHYQRAFQGFVKERGPDHEDTILMQARLGAAYRMTRRYDEARPLLEDAWRRQLQWESESKRERKLGVWLPREYALVLSECGENSEAEKLLRESIRRAKRIHGVGSSMDVRGQVLLGRHLLQTGKYAEAERLLAGGADYFRKNLSNRWETYEVLSLWGLALARTAKPDAEKYLVAGFEGLKERASRIPPNDRVPVLSDAAKRLADYYAFLGKTEDADRWKRIASAGP